MCQGDNTKTELQKTAGGQIWSSTQKESRSHGGGPQLAP